MVAVFGGCESERWTLSLHGSDRRPCHPKRLEGFSARSEDPKVKRLPFSHQNGGRWGSLWQALTTPLLRAVAGIWRILQHLREGEIEEDGKGWGETLSGALSGAFGGRDARAYHYRKKTLQC